MSAALIDTLLDGTQVRVRANGMPELVVDAREAAAAPPSALMKLLKPMLILERDGVELYRVAPYGEPSRVNLFPLLALAIVVGLALIFLR